MKVVYLKGNTILTDDQRTKYAGCRFENADAFAGVVEGIHSAVILGDYPAIKAELEEKKIQLDVAVDNPAEPKAPPKQKKPKPEQ